MGGTSAASIAADEEFLYHLHRGSEMLQDDRFVEAKEELEQALSRQPADARSQDLLAGVYFRLGVYPRAIEIWSRLLPTFPDDVALRVNLGLALLKTGQPDEALVHLGRAIELQPDHARAWRYRGLVLWRVGQLAEARDAFLRGGQESMAKRMEETLQSSPGALVAPQARSSQSIAPAPPSSEPPSADAALMRSAAEQAIAAIDAVQLDVESPSRPRRATGGWKAVELGEERVPRRTSPSRTFPMSAPPRLATVLESWSLAVPEGAALAVGPGGELLVQSKDALHMRLQGIRAVRGELRTTPVSRRARGRDLDGLLGGDRPIVQVRSEMTAVIAPPAGARFHAFQLDDDVLFVREALVWAFEPAVQFESGRLPLGGSPVEMVQLSGTGAVVLALTARPVALQVREGEPTHVAVEALVGWCGRLFPESVRGTQPYVSAAPPLIVRGEGVVLVT